MVFFKQKYKIRRYSEPTYIRGYACVPYSDGEIYADIQTMDNSAKTGEDGIDSVQKIKVFCNEKIYVETPESQRKSDRVWFQDKWFECKSSRLSNNTFIRHWVSTFVQCLDQDEEPSEV